MDDQFLIGHADESGDVHARFPSPQPVGAKLPGFNRGNLDWFHAYALKRPIRSVEGRFGDTWNKRPNPATPGNARCLPGSRAVKRFGNFLKPPGNVPPPQSFQANGKQAGKAVSWLSHPGEDTPRPVAGNKQE